MSYRITIHPQAEKEIRKLPTAIANRVISRIYQLADNPRSVGVKKLEGFKSERAGNKQCYRIRIGDLRVVYTIDEEIITLTVV